MALKITTPIQMRFSDADSFGHINNVALQMYFDLGKTDLFNELWRLTGVAEQVPAIVVSLNTDFYEQIFYGDQHGLPLRTEDFSSCGQLDLAWMVGPEGGFDEKELDLLSNAGRGITLGKYIFRLENAALAGIAHLYSTAYAAAAR